MDLYTFNSLDISKKTTNNYSTSFSLGVRFLGKEFRKPVYAIYGFVRFADEIVDTFHGHNQEKMFKEFRQETYEALDTGISSNPILHSFQWVVNTYDIDRELIDAFLDSMEMDLYKKDYSQRGLDKYIYGSAEVVGLMCLRIFTAPTNGYAGMVYYARKLGAAFQKVNFLRDLKDDYVDRGRTYFPGADFEQFDNKTKREIEEDIKNDFAEARKGIKMLEPGARFGVYLAYVYYLRLFKKIRRTDASQILKKRYRVSDKMKMWLFFSSYFRNKLGMI
jgi:phytoene/squalene synthetase